MNENPMWKEALVGAAVGAGATVLVLLVDIVIGKLFPPKE